MKNCSASWGLSLMCFDKNRVMLNNVYKCIILNENVWVPSKISRKFVPKGQSNNIPTLVQLTAWYCPADKPLSEPMMVSLPMHICVTRPPWFEHLEAETKGLPFCRRHFKAFSGMKMFKFLLKFHWSLFLKDQLTISQHWLTFRYFPLEILVI